MLLGVFGVVGTRRRSCLKDIMLTKDRAVVKNGDPFETVAQGMAHARCSGIFIQGPSLIAPSNILW